MNYHVTLILVLPAVLCVPSVAPANVGTPLMWASGLHLLFGNAAIGVFEGALLASVFKVPMSRAVGLTIVANYFSTWLGWVWLLPRIESQFQFDLYNTWGLLWKMVAVAYMLTLALEWPFVQWHVRHPTILPMDRVLFQFGERQICVLEPETRKIALLTFGRAPLAVLSQPVQPMAAAAK